MHTKLAFKLFYELPEEPGKLEKQVNNFLKAHPDFKVISMGADFGAKDGVSTIALLYEVPKEQEEAKPEREFTMRVDLHKLEETTTLQNIIRQAASQVAGDPLCHQDKEVVFAALYDPITEEEVGSFSILKKK